MQRRNALVSSIMFLENTLTIAQSSEDVEFLTVQLFELQKTLHELEGSE